MVVYARLHGDEFCGVHMLGLILSHFSTAKRFIEGCSPCK